RTLAAGDRSSYVVCASRSRRPPGSTPRRATLCGDRRTTDGLEPADRHQCRALHRGAGQFDGWRGGGRGAMRLSPLSSIVHRTERTGSILLAVLVVLLLLSIAGTS